MKSATFVGIALAVGALARLAPALAEEMVTIPKARLDELERKAAELDKLKAEQRAAESAPGRARAPGGPPVVKPARPAGPPVATLPPLREDEVVAAEDLAAHYAENPAAADQRYRHRPLRVRGVVAALEKPWAVRPYTVVLETGDPHWKVVGSVQPPTEFKAVFTVRRGEQMVGLSRAKTRVPLVSVGDTVVLEGRCKGGRDREILLTGCGLRREAGSPAR